MKQVLMFALLAMLLLAASTPAELSKTAPAKLTRLITGAEPSPAVPYYPSNPGLVTQSPGDTIGYTFYDYQTNGSTGNRVAMCDDGTLVFCWMNLPGWPQGPYPRHIFFNCLSPTGEWYAHGEGGPVSTGAGSGYANLDVIYGNRAAIAYHLYNISPHTILSIDYETPCIGFFDHYDPPDEIFPQSPDSPGRMYWPYVAVDRNDNIHLGMSEDTNIRLQRMCYTNSTDGGTTWSTLQLVDTVMVISSVLDASPVSDRVVFAYSKTQDTTTQVKNDIVYVVSEDGTTWDFRHGKINVTNYGDDPDSLWAYTDVDVIFDYNDNIHIVWTESWTSADGGSYFRTDIKHFDEASGEITTAVPTHVDSSWYDICGGWNKPVCKMNLGVSPLVPNGLVMTYTRFDTTDISSGGYGNGEIYMTFSTDSGQNWEISENLTNSPTPDCFPGECDSDHWSSLSDELDSNLHIIYINDKDAGGIPQTEGSATENPVMYMTFPNPLRTGIQEEGNRPLNFELAQNFPNPFNAKTTISFSLKEASPVTIEIFDLMGARVATLADVAMGAGAHDVAWDASHAASGVYYYKLSAGDQSETKQAVLIK